MLKIDSCSLRKYLLNTKALWLLGLFFVCSEALATVFTVIPTDRSVQYLGTIFGGSVGAVTLGGTVNPTLSKMFQGFNTIIVTMGGIILGYIGVISTINTAREGEAMGKKLNIWVPMRGIIGLLLMIPTPGTGYSVIQMTVMWIVLNGVGAANAVWNIAINQMAQGISAVGTINIPLTPANVDNAQLSLQVMASSTCMNYVNNQKLAQAPFNGGTQVTVFTADPVPVQVDPIHYNMWQTQTVYVGLKGVPGYQEICGSYQVFERITDCQNPTNTCTSSSVPYNQAVLTQRLSIKTQALTSMFSAVQDAGSLFTVTPYTTAPSQGYVNAARVAYINQISLLAGMAGAVPNNPGGVLQTMQQIGWAHAGSYYKNVVGASGSQITDPDLTPTNPNLPVPQVSVQYANMLPPAAAGTCPWPNWSTNLCTALSATPAGVGGLNNALKNLAANPTGYWYVDSAISPPSINGILNSPNNVTGNAVMDTILNPIFGGMTAAVFEFITQLTLSDDDPLISISKYGFGMMIASEVAIFALLIVLTGLAFAANWNDCIAPFGATATQISSQLFFLVTGICILLWSAGATLGLYTPMIPYLMFTTAVFGWFIAVIEAIVAAPILALALVQPAGEELGKAGHGLGILANLFLRPMLMIFGFILGANLARASLQLVNYGFIAAVPNGGSAFSFIPLMIMYAMLVIALINKSFSLIYDLPNQISRWLGGPAERHEGEKLMGEAKGGFDTGSKTVSETGSKVFDSGQKALKNSRQGGGQLPGGGGAGGGRPSGGGSGPGGGGGAGPGGGAGGGGAGGGAPRPGGGVPPGGGAV